MDHALQHDPHFVQRKKWFISACGVLHYGKFHHGAVKALSHGAIFLATCNAILPLVDVKLANTRFHHSLLTYS